MAASTGFRRKKYSIEFKVEAVKRYIENAHNNYRTAKEYGVPETTMQKWVAKYLDDIKSGNDIPELEDYKKTLEDKHLAEQLYAQRMDEDAKEIMKDLRGAKDYVHAKGLLLIEKLMEKISKGLMALDVENTKQMQEVAALIKSLNEILKATNTEVIGEEDKGSALDVLVKKMADNYEKKTGAKLEMSN